MEAQGACCLVLMDALALLLLLLVRVRGGAAGAAGTGGPGGTGGTGEGQTMAAALSLLDVDSALSAERQVELR